MTLRQWLLNYRGLDGFMETPAYEKAREKFYRDVIAFKNSADYKR